ncbi:MAG TPA: hypothetical protein ENK18_26015 [Deltaproteobacteria bacterium]|nr:hypothetical protein [Deltaproteobacteria bacterium]
MIYDETCTRGWGPIGLTHSWIVGARLYAALGRLDAWAGARSWSGALGWLARVQPDRAIGEVQFWGHGRWGLAKIDGEVLDASALEPGHRLNPALQRIRERMAPEGQWWFRTCETFGARRGQDFARRFTDLMGCAAAGHTHIIGPLQSGLHRLRPGAVPHWPAEEGVIEGTPDDPRRAAWSSLRAPNTVHCLRGSVPEGW